MQFLLIRWLLSALALWLTTALVPGLSFAREGVGPILVTALVMGLVNAVVRPVMVLLTLPLTVLTLGLFLLVVNALSLAVVATLTPLQVAGFFSAVFGALILSILNGVLMSTVKPEGEVVRR